MLHGPGFGRLYISMVVLSQYFSLRKIDRIEKQPRHTPFHRLASEFRDLNSDRVRIMACPAYGGGTSKGDRSAFALLCPLDEHAGRQQR